MPATAYTSPMQDLGVMRTASWKMAASRFNMHARQLVKPVLICLEFSDHFPVTVS